jgi:hypothetical protein
MNKTMRMALAMLVCGFGMLPHAQAGTQYSSYFFNPADNCQLSTPTIDTLVAPRATGYRNTGTKGVFVICGFSKMNGLPLIDAYVVFTSMDGQPHDVSCTGVNGYAGYLQTYATHTVEVPATLYDSVAFHGSDFGGNDSFIPESYYDFSITCNLPPQVSISRVMADFDYEIGN